MPERDRLTKRNESGGIAVRDMPAALEKLAELEDAEQDGRLVRLPYKVGRTVYALVHGQIKEVTVFGYRIHDAQLDDNEIFLSDFFGPYGFRYDNGENHIYESHEKAEEALELVRKKRTG